MMVKFHSRPLSFRQHQLKKRMWLSILPASSCLSLKAFKRGRASTKEWITFANQGSVIHSPSPLSKRACGRENLLSVQLGAGVNPPHTSYPALPSPGAWVAPTLRTLFPPSYYCGVAEKASKHISLLLLGYLSPLSPQIHHPSGSHRVLPHSSLLSSHFLLLHIGLGIRGVVRIGISRPLGTQHQGQKEVQVVATPRSH